MITRMAKLRRLKRRAAVTGVKVGRRLKARVRKEQDAAFVANVGVSLLQGMMKKEGKQLPSINAFGGKLNPELLWGGVACAAGYFSRGKSWEKEGKWLFYGGMPLLAIGLRAVAASGWSWDTVSGVAGYNAGFRIDADDTDDDPFDEGDI